MVPGPAGFEISRREIAKRYVPLGDRVVEPTRLHAFVERKNVVEAMKLMQRDDLVVEGGYVVRPNLECLVEPSQRLFIPAKPSQRHTDRVASLGVFGIELVRTFAVGQGLL